jgi:hypothetical protein
VLDDMPTCWSPRLTTLAVNLPRVKTNVRATSNEDLDFYQYLRSLAHMHELRGHTACFFLLPKSATEQSPKSVYAAYVGSSSTVLHRSTLAIHAPPCDKLWVLTVGVGHCRPAPWILFAAPFHVERPPCVERFSFVFKFTIGLEYHIITVPLACHIMTISLPDLSFDLRRCSHRYAVSIDRDSPPACTVRTGLKCPV